MEDYIIIGWPESQELMELEEFEDNCELLTNTEKFGSATYIVNKKWYNKNRKIRAIDAKTGEYVEGRYDEISGMAAIVTINPDSPSGLTWHLINPKTIEYV